VILRDARGQCAKRFQLVRQDAGEVEEPRTQGCVLRPRRQHGVQELHVGLEKHRVRVEERAVEVTPTEASQAQLRRDVALSELILDGAVAVWRRSRRIERHDGAVLRKAPTEGANGGIVAPATGELG